MRHIGQLRHIPFLHRMGLVYKHQIPRPCVFVLRLGLFLYSTIILSGAISYHLARRPLASSPRPSAPPHAGPAPLHDRNPATRIDTQDTANTLPGCCIFRIRYAHQQLQSAPLFFSSVFSFILSFLLTYATSSSVIRSSTAAYHQFPGLPNIQRQKILSLSAGIRGDKIPP